MIRSSLIAMLVICAVCAFCGKEFVTLGRHSWRCKQRLNHDRPGKSVNQMPVMYSPVRISNTNDVKCYCGKSCKGKRGLKMHQRSCRVLHGLNDELLTDLEQQSIENTDSATHATHSTVEEIHIGNDQSFPVLKKGINLPKSDAEWSTANSYFKFTLQLNAPIRVEDLSSSITQLNNMVYNYFAENYGIVEKIPDKALVDKYKDHTVKDLKKSLKQLKLSNTESREIRYVSRTLRNKLRNVNQNNLNVDETSEHQNKTFNHDIYIGKNFWGYVKDVLNTKNSSLPSLTMTECLT